MSDVPPPPDDLTARLRDPLLRAEYFEIEIRRQLAHTIRERCEHEGINQKTLTLLLQAADPSATRSDVTRLLSQTNEPASLELLLRAVAVLDLPCPLLVRSSFPSTTRPIEFHGEVVEDFGDHKHYQPSPADLVGKTIAEFRCDADNAWHILFADGFAVSIEAEAPFNGIPCMSLCNLCWNESTD